MFSTAAVQVKEGTGASRRLEVIGINRVSKREANGGHLHDKNPTISRLSPDTGEECDPTAVFA